MRLLSRHLGLLVAAASLCVSVPAQTQATALESLAAALIEFEIPSVDDTDRLMDKLLSAAHTNSNSAASVLAIEAAIQLASQTNQPAQRLQSIREITARPLHPLAALAAKHLEHAFLRRIGQPAEAVLHEAQADYASSMIAIGPFGDGGNYYAGVIFEPEFAFPRTSTLLEGRFGSVQSFVVERDPWLSRISLRPPGLTEVGCFYGLHQTNVDRALSAYLEITCAGSFELFVNDRQVDAIDRMARSLPQRLYFPVRLRTGNNRVLIKTTHNQQQRVSLRYVDARGATLDNCREVKGSEPLPLGGVGDPPDLLPPFIDGSSALRGAAASHPQNKSIGIAAMLMAFAHGETKAGLKLLTDLDDSPLADPRLRLALSRGYDMAGTLPAEIRNSRARALLDSAEPSLPRHHYALLRRSRFLAAENQPEQAIRLLMSELEAGRGGPKIYAKLTSLCADLDFVTERIKTLEAWRTAYPNDARPVLLLANMKDSAGDRQGTSDLLAHYQSRIPDNFTVQSQLFRIALDIGQFDLAQAMASAMQRGRVAKISDLRRYATLAEAKQERAVAIDLWHQIATHNEANADAIRMAGQRLLRAGQKQAAAKALERSLDKGPNQHSLRLLLSRLSGRDKDHPLIARYRYASDAIIANFEAGQREEGAPSSVLLDQMIVRFHADGTSVQETHQIRHINDLRGVETYEQAGQAAAAAEIINLRTIGTDGDTYLPTRVANSFAMPRLEPGAFIEEEYRNFSGNPGASPLRGPTFFFQSVDAPFLLTELVIILPPDCRGTFRVRNFTGESTVEELPDGYRAHIYRMRDVPRVVPQRLTPDTQDILPVVAFGEDRQLGEVLRAQHARLRQLVQGNPILDAKVAEITATLDDPRQQVAAIHDFAQAAIQNGSASQSPTETLLRGQGNRFFLITALVKAKGIPMQLALASQAHESIMGLPQPLFQGEESYPLPAALILPDSSEPIWSYAANPRYDALGSIPAIMLQAPVILLSMGQQELSRMPAGDRREGIGLKFTGELQLDRQGTIELTAKAFVRGVTGLDLAEQIRQLPADRRKLASRSLASQFFPGWTLRETEIGGLNPGSGLSVRVTMMRRSALNRAAENLLLPLPLPPSALFAELGGPGERSLPMLLRGMTHATWAIEFDPGDNYRIVAIPKPQLVRHDLLDYQLSYAMVGRKLQIRRSVTRRPGRLPASRYREWLDLLRRLDLAEAAQIKLRREG